MVVFPNSSAIAYGDVAAMAEFVRPILRPWFSSAHCYIINPADNTGGALDYDTGVRSDVTIHPVWDGDVRIQPIRRNLPRQETTNNTNGRTVQFQTVDFTKDGVLPDVQPGFQIVVSSVPDNQLLLLGIYVVTGTINSSMAWQHTIFAESNLEARPHYFLPTGEAVWPGEDTFPAEDLFPSDGA